MKRNYGFVFLIALVCNLVLLTAQLILMGSFGTLLSKTAAPLFVLPLVLANLLFFLYWLLRLKWPFLLFLASLLIGFQEYQLLYQLPNNVIQTERGLKVLSYNVRLFNKYKWKKETDLPDKIADFVAQEDPDILCFQEYSKSLSPDFPSYPYRYFKASQKGGAHGTCILSKFPFQKTGVIPFKESFNNGIFAEVKWKQNNLRVYNVHFESFGLQKEDSLFSTANPMKISDQLQGTLKKQLAQVQQFNALQQEKMFLICTDLNNNAFSKSYKLMKANRKDAFEEAGRGLGTTFWFSYFPFRIDYIFAAPSLRVLDFKTYKQIDFSDHKPIMAIVQ